MAWLSPAQIAALQQMDLCVWLPADEVAVTANNDAASQVDNQQASAGSSATNDSVRPQPVTKAPRDPAKSVARLSQLREQLGRTDEPAKTTSASSPAPSAAPKHQPLSAAQQAQYRLFIEDVERAWHIARPQSTFPPLAVGDALELTSKYLCLPALPDALSAPQKRHLWQTLCQQ